MKLTMLRLGLICAFAAALPGCADMEDLALQTATIDLIEGATTPPPADKPPPPDQGKPDPLGPTHD